MSKFFLVTGTDLRVDEFDSSEEVAQTISREVDDGELNPMDCMIFEGEQLEFDLTATIRSKVTAE